MRSTIIFPGSRISDFAGNSRVQKLNKPQTKQANITVVQYFCRLWYFVHINRSGVNFFLSFILSSFYFLTICANFPFRLHLRLCLRLLQSTLMSLSIVCPLRRMLCSRISIHRPLPSTAPCRYLPPLLCRSKSLETAENSDLQGRRGH